MTRTTRWEGRGKAVIVSFVARFAVLFAAASGGTTFARLVSLPAGLLVGAAGCRESADHTTSEGKRHPSGGVTVRDADGRTVHIADSSRIVSVGGGITEIIFALGAGARVVGADTSSVYPNAATRLPKVGYQRLLSVEGVLALRPSLVIASAEAGPPAALEQLRGSGVPILVVTAEPTLAGARGRIAVIAQALREEAPGRAVLARLEREYDESRRNGSDGGNGGSPRVLFIYARGQGTVNVSGRGTAADRMIGLAGGQNAMITFDGFRPLTAEAAIAAAPDVILIPARGMEAVGGAEAILGLPGLALTPAGRSGRIVAMDDLLLLGFGPRLGQAIDELARALGQKPALVKR